MRLRSCATANNVLHRLYTYYVQAHHHRGKQRIEHLLKSVLRIEDVLFRTPYDVLMRLNPSDLVQYHILKEGAYEIASLALISRLLLDAKCFVDVGGHVGQYALTAAKVMGRNGNVIVVEPNPRTFSYLVRNIKLNGLHNTTAILGAASGQGGLLRMQLPPDDNWGVSRKAATSGEVGDYLVPAFKLSDLVQELNVPPIDVLKVDVEGHEMEVLKGLFAAGQAQPKHIIFEFVPAVFQNWEIINYLRSRNYTVYDISGKPYEPNRPVVEGNLWARQK
jgi:FkbM family methyltransferase